MSIGLTQISAQTKTIKIEGFVPNGYWIPNGGDMTLNYNLIGNKGNQYVGTMIWDWVNDPLLENPAVIKAICN